MKKLFSFLLVCTVVGSVFGMKRARPDGSADELPCAKRRALSHEEQKKLNDELGAALEKACANPFNEALGKKTYTIVRTLLRRGASANGRYEGEAPLALAVDILNPVAKKIVILLLAHDANPNIGSDSWAVLPQTRDWEIIKLLVHAGADINGVRPFSGDLHTVLANTCCVWNCIDNVPIVVWLLNHGANPNKGPKEHEKGLLALHYVLWAHELKLVIVLVQGGAQLDVRTCDHEQPLVYAYQLWQTDSCARTVEGDQRLRAEAQYKFLKAVSEHRLDPHHVYTLDECEAMGISHESAELIQKATQEVNEAFTQCRLDDWQFEHPGQSLSKFILDRELGRAGRRRR